MLWRNRRGSDNVEDLRGGGMSGGRVALGGGGCVTLILAIVVCLLGGDPSRFLQTQQPQTPAPTSPTQTQNPNQKLRDEQAQFVSVVLADTEETWGAIFQKSGQRYRQPKLVIYDDQVQSACGFNSAASGPFYCPGDEKVYLDMSFFRELKGEFKAPGDFAQAYVIAHEVGHHIQNILGTSSKVDQLQRRARSEAQANDLSVRLELQADCYAGIWSNAAVKKGIVEQGDLEEAMRAAASVGDDTIQRRTQGYVVPESFSHGSSQQRMSWFKKGLETGDMRQCNTFAAR